MAADVRVLSQGDRAAVLVLDAPRLCRRSYSVPLRRLSASDSSRTRASQGRRVNVVQQDAQPLRSERSPWATTEEGAVYVRCPNRDAFRKWAKRAGIIPAYRGRVPLYAWRDIDQALGLPTRHAPR